ncbi:MAG: serine hydrolase domain-containing protein [Thermoanaerobaculia bacterium]
MLNKPGKIALLILLLHGTLAVVAGAQPPTSIVRLYQDLTRMVELGLFSGTVLVAQGEEILLYQGYGFADREKEVEFAPDTISTIGSITKQFTAAAILELEEQGRLSVEDPLSQFFADLPRDKADITLHQLLTHTAGMPDALGEDEDWIGRDAFLEQVWAAELASEPGSEYSYSNVGYSVLAAVIEGVSGQDYERFLRSTFFDPLGMAETGYIIPEFAPDRLAIGYRNGERWGTLLEKQDLDRGFSWHLVGNGGIHSTARDMFRWLRSLRTQEILTDDSTAKLFGRHVEEGGDSFYGYGWVTFDLPNGETMVGHNGGNGYLFEDLNFFPHRGDLAFYLMVNDESAGQAVSGYIVRVLTGQEVAAPPELHRLSSFAMEKLTGTYILASGEKLSVWPTDPGIELETPSWQVQAAVYGGEVAPLEELEAMSRETGRIVQAIVDGDLRPLFKAYGEKVPLDELQKVYGERLRDWEEEHGEAKSASVLGTQPDSRGFRTWVRIDFANGSIYQAWAWRSGSLAGWGPRDGPPPQIFYPVGPSEFASFSLAGGGSAHLVFAKNDQGALTLRLGVGPNSLVAKRLD